MKEIRTMLEARKKQLSSLKKEKEKALVHAPEGLLRVCCNGDRTQFYWRKDKKDKNGIYLNRRERLLVHKLAQKEYDQKVLMTVEKEINAIEKCLQIYPKVEAEGVYELFSEARKSLVIPLIEPEEEFLRKWEAVVYEGKRFDEETPEFYTAKNERVRSKSEWIIADILKQEGIPYRYEYPLYLKGMGQIYPDFMVLNVRTRKEYYWEHLGMMDDPDYAENALQKLSAYEQNGLYLGESLILTYETKRKPLNQKMIMDKINHYLK